MPDDGRRRGRRGSSRRQGTDPPPAASRTPPPSPVEAAAPLRGQCEHMCSLREQSERERSGEISRFERIGGRLSAVKKYRRAAAGTSVLAAEELRPPRVLLATLRHLFGLVLPVSGGGFKLESGELPSQGGDFLALYEFLADRARSVRQDLTVQRVEGEEIETALAQIARFHLLAGLRARQLPVGGAWSDKLNDEQLTSALSEIEAHCFVRDRESTAVAEFVAYDLLLHADDPRAANLLLLKTPLRVRHDERVQRALRAVVAFHLDDFRGFVALFGLMNLLEKAAAVRHLPRVWARSLAMLNKAFGKQDRVQLSELADWLVPRDDEGGSTRVDIAADLCAAMNVKVEELAAQNSSVGQTGSPDSWEDRGEVVLTDKSPPSTQVARFKANPLNAEIDRDRSEQLVRAIAAGNVLRQEADGGLDAAQLILAEPTADA